MMKLVLSPLFTLKDNDQDVDIALLKRDIEYHDKMISGMSDTLKKIPESIRDGFQFIRTEMKDEFNSRHNELTRTLGEEMGKRIALEKRLEDDLRILRWVQKNPKKSFFLFAVCVISALILTVSDFKHPLLKSLGLPYGVYLDEDMIKEKILPLINE